MKRDSGHVDVAWCHHKTSDCSGPLARPALASGLAAHRITTATATSTAPAAAPARDVDRDKIVLLRLSVSAILLRVHLLLAIGRREGGV